MRKKLLKDIKVNMQQYGYITFILREKPHPKFGLFLSTNHSVRELLIKTLSKITRSLNALDSRSIKGEPTLVINSRIQANTIEFLNLIKDEQKKQKDDIIKNFLHYIQVVSIEYKNRNNIDKRRFYKTFPDKQLFVNDLPTIENVKQGQLGDRRAPKELRDGI